VSVLDQIEYWHNRASDTEFVWFPFGCLRPLPSRRIGFKQTLTMSLSFGVYYGVFYILRRMVFGDAFRLAHIGVAILSAIGVFFIWFNLVTAYFWNRRARRMSLSLDCTSLFKNTNTPCS
jgi:hypothetical protein